MSTSVRQSIGSGSLNYQEDMALMYHLSNLPKNVTSHPTSLSVDVNIANVTSTGVTDSTLRMTTRHHQTQSGASSSLWREDTPFVGTDEARVLQSSGLSMGHKKK